MRLSRDRDKLFGRCTHAARQYSPVTAKWTGFGPDRVENINFLRIRKFREGSFSHACVESDGADPDRNAFEHRQV
jgi:hypothetical protein